MKPIIIDKIIFNAHQCLSEKLNGGLGSGNDKATGLMALCISLNIFCISILFLALQEVEQLPVVGGWNKWVIATILYVGCYIWVSYTVNKQNLHRDSRDKVSLVCSVLTSSWVLSSIFVIVPFALYVRAI